MKKGMIICGEENENLLKGVTGNICNKLLCSHSNQPYPVKQVNKISEHIGNNTGKDYDRSTKLNN